MHVQEAPPRSCSDPGSGDESLGWRAGVPGVDGWWPLDGWIQGPAGKKPPRPRHRSQGRREAASTLDLNSLDAACCDKTDLPQPAPSYSPPDVPHAVQVPPIDSLALIISSHYHPLYTGSTL